MMEKEVQDFLWVFTRLLSFTPEGVSLAVYGIGIAAAQCLTPEESSGQKKFCAPCGGILNFNIKSQEKKLKRIREIECFRIPLRFFVVQDRGKR
jgi:hypothetical protein